MSIHRVKYGNWAAWGLFALAGSLWLAAEAGAGFVLGSADARSDWPLQTDSDVLFWTSYLPTGAGDGGADNRGVRSNRIQAQTFQVVDNPISIESIYFGYRYNDGNQNTTLPTTFRIVEIPNIGAGYDHVAAPVSAAPFSTTVVPGSPVDNGYFGLRLDWTGAPLMLNPLPGQQGYAFEIVGGGSVSPIASLHRPDTIPQSRAMEMDPNGASGVITGLNGNPPPDFVMVITGTVIPEPATIMLAAVALAGCVGFGRRRR